MKGWVEIYCGGEKHFAVQMPTGRWVCRGCRRQVWLVG